MRIIAHTIKMIDDASRLDTKFAYILRILLFCNFQTMADKLWNPFKLIVFSPINTLFLLFILYLCFCAIFVPLYLASIIITIYGSSLLFVILLIYGLRILATILVFPGSSKSVQRDISIDFLKRLTTQLETVAGMCSNFISSLVLVSTGQINFADASIDCGIAPELMSLTESFNHITEWLNTCASILENQLTTTQLENLMLLKDSISGLVLSFQELQPIISPKNLKHSSFPVGNHTISNTLVKCLQLSENLKTAAAAIKPDKTKAEGVFAALNNNICKCNSGPQGLEKLSFLIMREQLRSAYKGKYLTIPVTKKHSIDAILIPSNTRAQDEGITESLGTVLFCNPNAGYFECMAQSSKDHSWLGMYTQIGFDVCLFNYRGYLRSTGTPTPSGIMQDGETVAKYLKQHCQVTKLILHGESIGGMVACHVANKMNVSLLVVDRSFASLESLAGRLVGSWARIGLTWLALWKTNAVKDFINADCQKIMLQDPNDEIIANGSSLKTGVATTLLVNATHWNYRKISRKYAIADASGQRVPHQNTDKIISSLRVNALSSVKITEEFIEHFSASLTEIARRINMTGSGSGSKTATSNTSTANDRKKLTSKLSTGNTTTTTTSVINGSDGRRQTTSGSSNSGLLNELELESNGSDSDAEVEEEEEDDLESNHPHSNNNSNNTSSTRKGQRLTEDNNVNVTVNNSGIREKEQHRVRNRTNTNTSNDEEKGIEMSVPLQKDQNGFNTVSSVGFSPIRKNKYSAKSKGSEENPPPHVALTKLQVLKTKCHSNEEWLEQFCSLNILDPSSALTPLEKVWVVCARTDGCCGELLGQALWRQHDGVRTWLCSLLVWSQRAVFDVSLPRQRTDVFATLHSLQHLVSSIHPTELGNDATVLFMVEAFQILCEVVTKEMTVNNGSISNSNHNKSINTESSNGNNSSSISTIGGRGDIGLLIPLHCGHNGWPGIAVKLMFLELLRKYNFNIDNNTKTSVGGIKRIDTKKTHLHS